MMLKYSLVLFLLSTIVSVVFGKGCRVDVRAPKTVTSPNYPKSYGSSPKCYTNIYAPEGKIVQIKILDIDLPEPNYNGRCRRDYVILYDGPDVLGSQIGPTLCGTKGVGSAFKSTQEKVLIYFKGDSTVGKERGYKFEIKFIDPPVVTTTTDATATTTTGPTTTRAPGDHVWFNGQCGTSKYNDAGEFGLSARIIGGTQARRDEYPWQMALVQPTGRLSCGGSIVNENWVITAAHCVYPNNKLFIVAVGNHNIELDEEPGRQTFGIVDLWIHNNYDPETFNNDIALIKLDGNIKFSENVMPVCAPIAYSSDHAHEKGVISGWGRSRNDDGDLFSPSILLYTTINITTRAYCQEDFDRLNSTKRFFITENMICGSDNQGEINRDTCQGDSGGPLTIKGDDGRFVLVGLTSWGVGCATGTPGVYTKVANMMNWIQNVMDSNS